MDQTLVNWLLAGLGGLIGFLLNVVWQAVKDLQRVIDYLFSPWEDNHCKNSYEHDVTKAAYLLRE